MHYLRAFKGKGSLVITAGYKNISEDKRYECEKTREVE